MSWLPVVVGAAKNRVVALKTDRSIRFSLSRIFFASSSSLVPNFGNTNRKQRYAIAR